MNDYIELLKSISKHDIPNIDLHLHTNWTDGKASVSDMYNCAVKNGLEYILFSEHVRKSSDEWFKEFAGDVRKLPREKCVAFLGAETRIVDFEGNLDCSYYVKSQCDLLIASVHRFPGKNGLSYTEFTEVPLEKALEMEFRLTIAAIENPWVDIIGHLFGMCLKRYGVVPPQEMVCEIVKKAARYNVAIEVNSCYHPTPWILIDLCKQEGALITLGSDAHCVDDVGKIVRVLKGEEASWNL